MVYRNELELEDDSPPELVVCDSVVLVELDELAVDALVVLLVEMSRLASVDSDVLDTLRLVLVLVLELELDITSELDVVTVVWDVVELYELSDVLENVVSLLADSELSDVLLMLVVLTLVVVSVVELVLLASVLELELVELLELELTDVVVLKLDSDVELTLLIADVSDVVVFSELSDVELAVLDVVTLASVEEDEEMLVVLALVVEYELVDFDELVVLDALDTLVVEFIEDSDVELTLVRLVVVWLVVLVLDFPASGENRKHQTAAPTVWSLQPHMPSSQFHQRAPWRNGRPMPAVSAASLLTPGTPVE